MIATSTKIEVVLEIDGEYLVTAGIEDFIRPPTKGAEYLLRDGTVYEAVNVIESVGDNNAAMLTDLLSLLFPEAGKAELIAGTLKPIDINSELGNVLVLPRLQLVTGQANRLIYVRLMVKWSKPGGRLLHFPSR